jgi:hypothetical protein
VWGVQDARSTPYRAYRTVCLITTE